MGLFVTLILGLFIILGALMSKLSSSRQKIEQLAVAVAFGSMISLAIFDLIGETYEYLKSSPFIMVLGILAGIIVLKILDNYVPDHDHHQGFDHDCTPENISHIGIMSTLAVAIHNIVEGMAVYSICNTDLKSGMLMGIGVGLHNLPMGLVIESTLSFEKKSKRWFLLAVAGLSTFAGGLIMNFFLPLVSEKMVGFLMSFALGMIAYIVVLELFPHICHGKDKKLSFIGMISGFTLVWLSTLL